MLWLDYALIRYTPDARRGETVNIGLIVFLPDHIDMRLLNSSAKIRILDGKSSLLDLDNFEAALRSLPLQQMEPNERYPFISSLFKGVVSLSEKGRFSVDLESQYEAKLDHLFNTLVKPHRLAENKTTHSRLTTSLRNKFKTKNLLANDPSELSLHKVVANYPISEKTGITADFLIKNGVYHISEVVDFNVNNTQAKLRETSLKTMTFLTGKKELGESTRCYFVYSASLEKEKDIMPHLNMVEDYSDKMFNVESRQEMNSYLSLVSELTHTTESLIH